MTDLIKRQRPGWIEGVVLLLYTAGIIVTTCFHEPWFDELQAWEIARCTSLHELMFEIPHYEGHPQLWHLLLRLCWQLGIPGIPALRILNTLFCTAAMALLLFRSPLPRIARCLLPFNYYFFYHYGVLSRPYSMMILATFLVAMTYQKRNTQTGRYVLSLLFLCFTSVYGVVLAGGVCIVWTVEILCEYKQEKKWHSLLRDKRPYWLLLILAVAMFLLFCLMPAPDCFYSAADRTLEEKIASIPDYLFRAPINAIFGLTLGEKSIVKLTYTRSGMIIETVSGIVLWIGMILLSRKNRKLLLFAVPLLMYALFGAFVQMAVHHYGIALMYLIFLFWEMIEEGMRIPDWVHRGLEKLSHPIRRLMAVVCCMAVLVIPAVYTGFSIKNEILYAYGPQEIAGFIRDNHLENRSFMTIWDKTKTLNNVDPAFIFDETLPAKGQPELEYQYPLLQGLAMMLSSYLGQNVFPYYNDGRQDKLYMPWTSTTPEENAEIFAEWSQIGLPDFVIGPVRLEDVFPPEQLDGVTYYWIASYDTGRIFKLAYGCDQMRIYIRNDLLDEYPQFSIHTFKEESAPQNEDLPS